MINLNLTPTLKAIADKVLSLQTLTRETGFHTSRSIGALLANLSPDQLAAIGDYLRRARQQAEVERAR
jgi:hypothetical protein